MADLTELLACARYVEEASNAIEGCDRGRELARKVKAFCHEAASPESSQLGLQRTPEQDPILRPGEVK